MVTATARKKARRSSVSGPARILSNILVVATIVWVVTDLLIWIVILVVGAAQGTIPDFNGPSRHSFYTAAPGYPAFHVPLAVYIVLALVWLVLSVIAVRPRLRGGFFSPQILLAQNIVFAIGDFVVAESFAGAEGWPHLAWIASAIRIVAAIVNVVTIVRERGGKRR